MTKQITLALCLFCPPRVKMDIIVMMMPSKDSGQQSCNREADLRLCFRICKMLVIS